MASALTPEEFELHLADLRERLLAHLGRGEGNRRSLLRDAEQVLALRDDFPEIYARHGDVEGMIADLLALRQQEKFSGSGTTSEPSGCLLGWLFGRRSR